MTRRLVCICSVLLLGFAALPARAGDGPISTAPGDTSSAGVEGYRRTAPHGADVLKLRGEFGLYVGHVRSITPAGLAGFEDVPYLRTGLPKPEEPLSWDRITSVERRGNEATKGAVIGAAVLLIPGIVAGGFGPAFENELDSPEVISGAVAGGLTGLLFGAAIGGAIGLAIPAWQAVYRRVST